MKVLKSYLLVGVLFQLGGCAYMSNRTYLTEMEQEDTHVFTPREDFPVVAGDEGRTWRTDSEIRARTPASYAENLRDRHDTMLEQELARLESAQSSAGFKHYQQYRHKLGSTSERIYFLQMKGRAEREDYLAARGLLDSPLYTAAERSIAAHQSDVVMGMSKDDVLSSWGHPARIDVAGHPRYENERWTYQTDGATKHIFFEGGKVEGWTNLAR